MTALALPRIGPQVPSTIAPGPLLAVNAQVSRFLIEAGAFDEADLPPEWVDSLRACQYALDRWLKRQIGPLHCLAPRFSLHTLTCVGDQISYYEQMSKRLDIGAVVATWTEYEEREWDVGDALTALNDRVPGLGTVVLHVMRHQCRWVYPLFTPDVACDVASYLYWSGEEDEEAALDLHCGENEEDREAMRAEMVSKAMLTAAYPAWARQWPRKLDMPQCARLLRRAIKRLRDPKARAVAADALALCGLEIDDVFRPAEVEGEFIGFGAVLSWSAGDVTTRIYDDLLNLAHQAEYCEHMGEIEVPLDDPAKFAAWQRAMASRFEAIRLIDRLIHCLAAGD